MSRSEPVAGAHGTIVQIAYAVDDVRTAARRMAADLGAGPFFVRRHPPLASAEHAGSPAVFDHSSAYGQWGALQIELVQVHAAEPATLAAAVDPGSGLHHVAMFAESIEAEQSRLEQCGFPCVLDAVTDGGVRFAFHDARHSLGHLLEIYEPSPGIARFYEMVRTSARAWDGSDPVREL